MRAWVTGGMLLAMAAGAWGQQAYPVRPVRLVVPFPPGGGSDLIARPYVQKMAELTGQQFVVDNRGGANGNIGAEHAARSAPDGYTIFMANSSMTISASLYAKLAYDPVRDFAPVSLAGITPSVLVVHPSLPVRSVREFVALARSRPGKLNFGSSGVGSTMHLGAELLKAMAKLDMVHVPYKGGGPAITDVIAGQLELVFVNPGPVLGQLQAGRLRPLAVTSLRRVQVLPDVPTFDESGLKGFESNTFYGVLAPAGTSREVVARLNALTVAAITAPDTRERLVAAGYEVVTNTPEQFAAFLRKDIDEWARLVRLSGAKAE